VLVTVRPFGRLGNRLFLATHLLAYCWKYDFELANLAFHPFEEHFPKFPQQPKGLAERILRFRSRLPWERRVEYWEDEALQFDDDSLEDLSGPLRTGKTVFFHAWLIRGNRTVGQYRDRILKTFEPRPEVLSSIEAFWSHSIRPKTTVVGVHIRWEDYRGTANFLTLEEYQRAMHRMVQLLGAQPIQFVVFSNETLDAAAFSDFDATLAHGSAIEDLYTMARCDYLLAPPSTFSGWASFYGAVPILWLNQGRPDYELKDFEIVRG